MPRDFYESDLVVTTYDLLTEQTNQQISGDVSFYLDCAERFGSPVLELGVGTSRIARTLARAGHDVVGLDRSKGMLEAARKKCETLADTVDLIEADITAFELHKKFPLALIAFNTFQHLTTPDQHRDTRGLPSARPKARPAAKPSAVWQHAGRRQRAV